MFKNNFFLKFQGTKNIGITLFLKIEGLNIFCMKSLVRHQCFTPFFILVFIILILLLTKKAEAISLSLR